MDRYDIDDILEEARRLRSSAGTFPSLPARPNPRPRRPPPRPSSLSGRPRSLFPPS